MYEQFTRPIAGVVYVAKTPPSTIAWLQLGGYRDGNPQGWALVDADLIDELNEFRWVLMREYAARAVWQGKGQKKRNIYLHRWIMGLEPGDKRVVDHINRDEMDNRRMNLRVVTRGQNLQNLKVRGGGTSRYRGVRKDGNRWLARCKVAGREVHIGSFLTEDEAAAAALTYRREHLPFSTD